MPTGTVEVRPSTVVVSVTLTVNAVASAVVLPGGDGDACGGFEGVVLVDLEGAGVGDGV